MSEITFIEGGNIAVSTLIEKLGFQLAYSVNNKLEITETLVCVNTTLEYESELDVTPPCGEPLLFESLLLARKYIHKKNIETTNTLEKMLATRKSTLAYKVSCLWHSFMPSDKGVKPAVDSFEEYVNKQKNLLKIEEYSELLYTALPESFTCGAILPIGSNIYNLRADNILFDGKYTLSESQITGAEPMYISLEKKQLHIRYCLNHSRNYMLDPDDTCKDGILKKCFANSRYFVDKKAALKTFEELKNVISLDIS